MCCQFCKEEIAGDFVQHGWKLWHPRCYDKMLLARPSTSPHMRVAILERLYAGVIVDAATFLDIFFVYQEAAGIVPVDFSTDGDRDSRLVM